MSDQRQNKTGGSTLYGAPLPEIIDSSKNDVSNSAKVDDRAPKVQGLVIDIAEELDNEKNRKPAPTHSNTDVRLLRNAFGDDSKKGAPVEELNKIASEQASNQPKRHAPPPIPRVALRREPLTNTQPLAPYASSVSEVDDEPGIRLDITTSKAEITRKKEASKPNYAIIIEEPDTQVPPKRPSNESFNRPLAPKTPGLGKTSTPTQRHLQPTLDFSDDTKIVAPKFAQLGIRESMRKNDAEGLGSEKTVPPTFQVSPRSSFSEEDHRSINDSFGREFTDGHRLGSEVRIEDELAESVRQEEIGIGNEITGQGLAQRIETVGDSSAADVLSHEIPPAEITSEGVRTQDFGDEETDGEFLSDQNKRGNPISRISVAAIPNETSGYGSDVSTSKSENLSDGPKIASSPAIPSFAAGAIVDDLPPHTPHNTDDDNEATTISLKRRRFTLGPGSGQPRFTPSVPPQYDELSEGDVFSEPIEESQPLAERIGQVEMSNPMMQRVGTGTVAFMPHDDLPLDDDDLNDDSLDGHSGNPSLEEGSLELNSECMDMEDRQPIKQPSDIPMDASGYPMAKIIRTRKSSRPKSDSSKGYHHLSSAGLYDRPSVQYMREEISDKTFLSTVSVKAPSIDINLAAALEVACGADRPAAMRTPTLISSIILKNPQQIEALTPHFPGPLFVDPFELSPDEVEPVSKHGPIVCAISKLQMVGVNFLTRFLRHPDRLHRFYSMMLIYEMFPQSALKVVIDRLSDEDPDIRINASSILLKRRAQSNFDSLVLEPLRTILGSDEESDERIKYAARFLAIVLDAKAVPVAIRLLEQEPSDSKIKSALELLKSVTLQRFQNVADWKRWSVGKDFDGRYARILWLIDALNDSSLAIRRDAYEQLNPTFGTLLTEYLPTHPEPLRRRIQNTLRVQFQKK